MDEPGYSDSTSPISEAPDITNWFSSYVYESFPFKESEIDANGFSIGEEKENLGVAVSETKSAEKFVSNKYHKPISNRNLCESLPSEPPDIGNWFSSYIYESPILDTSDGLELSPIPEESERVKETQTEEETTSTDGNHVCPEQQLVSSSAKVTDFTQSQSLLSEPPHVRNWFSSYEYQSPQLSVLSSSQKDELIIDESDTENENACGIFRKTKSKQETISKNISADAAKEVFSDNAYSDQEMEKKLSFGSNNEKKQESSFKQDPLFCEPRFNPTFSLYNPKQQSPKHIQETNSIRQKSPRKAARKACLEENVESVEKESDVKENVYETGFVTMKKARFREPRDHQTKPNRGVLVEVSRSRELKMIDREEEEEERKKKRRVLGEMPNLQFCGAEEIAGKWRCPQKNKVKSGPPLKQLRLDAWIHKV